MSPTSRPIRKGKISDEQINARYLEMLPLITMIARQAFSGYDPEKRDEAVQNVLAWALVNLRCLAESGKFAEAKATPLAWYAVGRHRVGRTVGVPSSTTDVLSEGCRVLGRSNIKYYDFDNNVEEIFHSESVMFDARCPLDLTADLKMDYENWLHQQTPKDQQIIHDLSMGYTTNEVAAKYGVTASAISIKRRKYEKSWSDYINPAPEETTCSVASC